MVSSLIASYTGVGIVQSIVAKLTLLFQSSASWVHAVYGEPIHITISIAFSYAEESFERT